MKTFISWSGTVSHKVATVLRNWLPSVIQSVEPYVSSEDIDKGARWSTHITAELDQSAFGILCVTKDNVNAPWLNFEAGALGKSVDKSCVCPFLFRIKRSEVSGPILQFQSTICEKDDVLKLLKSINASCAEQALDEARLEKTFDVWWPSLKKELDGIPEEAQAEAQEKKHPQQKTIREIVSVHQKDISLTGTWACKFLGPITIDQTGLKVIGKYPGGGIFEGTLIDRVLPYKWSEKDSGEKGQGVLILSNENTIFAIWWAENESGSWGATMRE